MFELSQFNEYREDNRREVKAAKGGLPDSLWSTYSAFVNCHGGVIIPGSIRTGKEQMLKGGISDPRNKALMKMFNMIGIGERAGSGVPDIYSVWENQGWIAPQVIEEYAPDRTILKLSFIKMGINKKTIIKSSDQKLAIKIGDQKSAKTEERLQQILQYMKDGTAYHSDEIAESIGLKSSRTRELLNMLVKKDRLESIGENRNRRYQKKMDVR